MKWGPAPPVFQAGAEMAVLEGNPAAQAPYVVRLKMPDGYKIMPHWHPTTENVTVISGTFHLGTGATFDEAKGMHSCPPPSPPVPPARDTDDRIAFRGGPLWPHRSLRFSGPIHF